MNQCSELHKAMSEAEVAYQNKFDELKKFESLNFPPSIKGSLEEILNEWERLREEERAAYENREEARNAYRACLKSA